MLGVRPSWMEMREAWAVQMILWTLGPREMAKFLIWVREYLP